MNILIYMDKFINITKEQIAFNSINKNPKKLSKKKYYYLTEINHPS